MLHNHETRDLDSESTSEPHMKDVSSDLSHLTSTTALQGLQNLKNIISRAPSHTTHRAGGVLG